MGQSPCLGPLLLKPSGAAESLGSFKNIVMPGPPHPRSLDNGSVVTPESKYFLKLPWELKCIAKGQNHCCRPSAKCFARKCPKAACSDVHDPFAEC